MKPHLHAQSSVKRYGGKPTDYFPIHDFLDLSKGAIADNRHRCLTHTSWFLSTVLERVFGATIKNSDGKEVSVRDIGEQHVIEDLGFIPTPQDYIQEMEYKSWMNGFAGGKPPSFNKINEVKRVMRWKTD